MRNEEVNNPDIFNSSSDNLTNYGVEAPAEQQLEPVVFRYRKPDLKRRKGVVPLVSSDILFSAVQVISEGGENNLHAHTAMDGFWMVLKGTAKFYGPADKLIATLGPMEGILIPRGVPYWFESGSKELLELLQIEAFDRSVEEKRLDYEKKKGAALDFQIFSQEGKVLKEIGS